MKILRSSFQKFDESQQVNQNKIKYFAPFFGDLFFLSAFSGFGRMVFLILYGARHRFNLGARRRKIQLSLSIL